MVSGVFSHGAAVLVAEHSERPFSTLETRSRISSFQSHASRQDREFLSLNLVLRDENENFFYQSQTSRRERKSRLRQFSREFSRITFIPCLMTDIFKKKAVIFSKFPKILCPFFSRNLNKNLIFRDENGNFFSTSHASRRERDFFILISCFEKETRI